MKKGTILIATAILGLSFTGVAQKLAAEKNIEVGERKERGYLGNVVVDDTKQQLDLVYVTKSTNRKIKFKAYQFDYDLNLINEFMDEQELDKARTKYKWFNFRGKDQEVVTGIEAKASMGGKAMFVKKQITYTYSWLTGRYSKRVKTLEKLKPKTEYGKMYFHAGYQLDLKGEAMAFVGTKGEKMKDLDVPWKKYRVLRVNSNMDIVSDEAIDFDHVHQLIWQGPIVVDGDIESADWGILMAPTKMPGVKEMGPDPTAYTFLRIGQDGKLKNRTVFNTKSHEWLVNGAVEQGGMVYLYGPGLNKKVETTYMNTKKIVSAGIRTKGFECFQIVGLVGNNSKFVSSANMDQFEAANRKPGNQKKPVVYSGGRVKISGIDITAAGDIFISGQEFAKDITTQQTVYKDFHVFHFNASGELQNAYGIDNPQKKGLKGLADANTDPRQAPTDAAIFQGTNPEEVFWLTMFIAKIDKVVYTEGDYQITEYHPKLQPRIGKMNTADGTIGDMIIYGGEDNFLYEDYPFVKINGGKQTVFLGSNKSGKSIWLGKFDPAQL